MTEEHDDHLPDTDAALLAQSLAPQLPEGERAAHMKARILKGIRATPHAQAPSAIAARASGALLTVRVQDRQWQQVARGVEMCTLHEDDHSRSILLRMQPDSFLLPHRHAMSEESILLEGDALIGEDLRLAAGDFHFSPAGALHPLLRSPGGCIVYVRGEKAFHPRLTTGLFKHLLRGLSGSGGKDPI